MHYLCATSLATPAVVGHLKNLHDRVCETTFGYAEANYCANFLETCINEWNADDVIGVPKQATCGASDKATLSAMHALLTELTTRGISSSATYTPKTTSFHSFSYSA